MKNVNNKLPLFCLIAGFERGGTTLLLNILKQHPNLDAGFEGGLLLAKSPKDFINKDPYFTMLHRGWKINKEYLIQALSNSPEWMDAYRNIINLSSILKNKNVQIIDKTPKYLENLPQITKKVPQIPCIVIVRDPRSVIWSWAKRMDSSINIKKSCERYLRYYCGWKNTINKNRIYLIKYESLCLNPEAEIQKLFNFLKLDYSTNYLKIVYNKNISIHGNQVNTNFIDEYKRFLTQQTTNNIIKLTEQAADWHWN
jgi:hypothetical protein